MRMNPLFFRCRGMVVRLQGRGRGIGTYWPSITRTGMCSEPFAFLSS